MGAKYLPTIRDLKATERFQRQQDARPKFKKPSSGPPAKKKRKR